jgi:hypothetical protein
MTTGFCIDELDQILWSRNTQVGIIAQTRDDGKDIFTDRLKFSFDTLDPRVRPAFRLVGDSADELAFSHGSVIRVGTSLRSSTLQCLHVSEFGKICAKYPEKAKEIITGSLNTVHAGQQIVIESTAEGKEGYFYDMCQKALERQRSSIPLSPLDFKFFFFPWWQHPEYRLEHATTISKDLQEYYAKLFLDGIVLDDSQKYWYAKKYETQKEDMLREYPSTPEEAFAASQEGFWYSSQMQELYAGGHICNVSYDRALPVYTAWDLGQADFMCIWFFQITRQGDVNIIDYFQKRDMPLNLCVGMLASKGYTYGTHIWPHDANSRDRSGITFVQQARQFNLSGIVLEPHSLRDGINLVRNTLGKCWFDKGRCKEGILALENYKKTWSSKIGGWSSDPAHDDASHGADAFRYLCSGLDKINPNRAKDSDTKALNAWFGR